MQEEPIHQDHSAIPPQTAVSVYGQSDAMDDFPVLKAFQQYVDAEQAKAHKRMMTVCIFFTVLMMIVISVFLLIIFGLNHKDPGHSDLTLKLMEMNQQLMTQDRTVGRSSELEDLKARLREQELEKKVADRLTQVTPPAPVIDIETQKKNQELALRIKELELERQYKEKMDAEVANRPPAPLTEQEKIALDEALANKARLLKEREAKLKAREEKVAADTYSAKAREKAYAEIKAANEAKAQAQAEADAAIARATTAERAAQAAQEKAEDAEREAELKAARLAKREREIAAKERELARLKAKLAEPVAPPSPSTVKPQAVAEPAPAAPTPAVATPSPSDALPVLIPAVPVAKPTPPKASKPPVAKPGVGVEIEVDEVLEFLDTLDDSPTNLENKIQPSVSTEGYEMPLE